jgi:hypothetical protein
MQQCKKSECNKAITSQNKNADTNKQKGPDTMKKIISTLAISTIIIISMTGCTKTQEGAGIGAVVGALAGQAIGGDTGATLIGAGAGAIVGGAVGNNQE